MDRAERKGDQRMKLYRVIGAKVEALGEKVAECVWIVFEGIKQAIKESWENIKENYYIVLIVLGLFFAYPFIVKLIGG